MHWKAPLLAVLLPFIAFSCRKDKDETAPSVRITWPAEGTTMAVPDTLVVRVEVSDDRIVQSLVIELSNEQGIPVVPGAVVPIGTGSTTIERAIAVNSERLLSGTYTITARASDGTNDGRAFRSIQILEAPLRLRSVFLSPAPNTDVSTIQRVDSTGQVSDHLTTQDLSGVAVDSYFQYLLVAGTQYAPFQALPTSGSGNPWQMPPPATDAPQQFASLTVDPWDGLTYFSTRDGTIRGATGEGVPRFNAHCLTGHRCEAIVVLGTRIATWQRAIVGNAQVLVAYGPAGTIMASMPVEHERVALFRLDNGRLLHFANEGGNGLIQQVDIDAIGTPGLQNFPEGSITAVTRLDNDRYVVALPTRTVLYRYSTNSIATLNTVPNIVALAFDPATGTLFAGQGTDLLYIDPNNGQVLSALPTGTEIAGIHPLRNR